MITADFSLNGQNPPVNRATRIINIYNGDKDNGRGGWETVWSSDEERWGRRTTNIFMPFDQTYKLYVETTRKGSFFGKSPTLTIHSIKPILRPFEVTLRGADPLYFLIERGEYVPNTSIGELQSATSVLLEGASNTGRGTAVKFSGDRITLTSSSPYSYIKAVRLVGSNGKTKVIRDNCAVGTTSVSIELTNDFIMDNLDYVTFTKNGNNGQKGQITVQPVMGYYDTEVSVHDDYRGKVEIIRSDNSANIHKGDTLRLRQTLNDEYKSTYTDERIHIVVKNSNNGKTEDILRKYDDAHDPDCVFLNTYSKIDIYRRIHRLHRSRKRRVGGILRNERGNKRAGLYAGMEPYT